MKSKRHWRAGCRWGILGLVCLMLTGCAGRRVSLVLVTPTPLCQGTTPPTVVSGTVQQADQLAATVSAGSATVTVIHYTAATRFTQVNLSTASALSPGERAQILMLPSDGVAIPTARAIVVQNDQGAVAAPAGCATPAQAGDPELQGTITSVNATSQQVTLVDDRNVPYVLLFATTTIIGQPGPAQQSDIRQGNLILASGTATRDGITADQVMILTTTTA